MKLFRYLGHNASEMLSTPPFNGWSYEKSLEEDLDLPIIHYIVKECGLELRCDLDDKVSVIFVNAGRGGVLEPYLGVTFESTRAQVLECFGAPTESGEQTHDPILGKYGAWDRFAIPGGAVHVEYNINDDSLAKVTFMRDDVAP